MEHTNQATTIEAELRADFASAQVMCFQQAEAHDHTRSDAGVLWLDLCLTRRLEGARASFPERWSKHRLKDIGELFFVPPGEVLFTRSGAGSVKSLMCRIDADRMSRWLGADLQWNDRRLAAGLDIRDPSIRCHLMRLAQEVSHPGFASETVLELIASQVTIELGRYFASLKSERAPRGLATWRLRLLDERVHELGKAPTLTELAKLCGLSVRQLSRGFRASRGCSIGHYVEQSRVGNAKRLLTTGQSVKAVAYAMGFASPSGFSYAFRRATGASPVEFRRASSEEGARL